MSNDTILGKTSTSHSGQTSKITQTHKHLNHTNNLVVKLKLIKPSHMHSQGKNGRCQCSPVDQALMK